MYVYLRGTFIGKKKVGLSVRHGTRVGLLQKTGLLQMHPNLPNHEVHQITN